MKEFRIFAGFLAVAAAAFAGSQDACAGDINGAAMAGLVLNNTSPDSDFFALSRFAGVSTNNALFTSGTDTTTGFTETVSGTFAGQPLNVTYTGDSTLFPAGAITWTSSGNFGAQVWSGIGSAIFTFPTASTFQVAYNSALSVGANIAANNSIITGADDGTWLSYTGTTGTLTITSPPMPPIPQPAPMNTQMALLELSIGSAGFDDYEKNGRTMITSFWVADDVEKDTFAPFAPTRIEWVGTLQVVPEPTSLILAGLGFLSVFGFDGSRRAVKSCAR